MDLTTLLTVAGLFLSVVAGNAAIFGESLFASIAVPKSLETAGFDQATAERLFAAEMASFTRVPAILPTPNVTTSTTPSFTMALAKPLQLQDVVRAIQSQIRQDVASANGAVVHDASGKGLAMVMIVHMPPDPPVTLTISQPDGDVRVLLTRAARETMETIAPYRVALSDLAGNLSGDRSAFAKARATAERGLTQPWDPSVQGATEAVLLRNLLAVLATERRDGSDVRRHLATAHATPGAAQSAYAMLWLNEAFFALSERRTADAQRLYDKGMEVLGRRVSHVLYGRALVLEALIAWQAGDVARAEALLRESLTDGSEEVEPWFYLSRIALERGDKATAESLQIRARIASRFDQHYASLAHTILPIDVKTGAFIEGAFLPNREGTAASAEPIVPQLNPQSSGSSTTPSLIAPAAAAAAVATQPAAPSPTTAPAPAASPGAAAPRPAPAAATAPAAPAARSAPPAAAAAPAAGSAPGRGTAGTPGESGGEHGGGSHGGASGQGRPARP